MDQENFKSLELTWFLTSYFAKELCLKKKKRKENPSPGIFIS